jgi:hypothetical protein
MIRGEMHVSLSPGGRSCGFDKLFFYQERPEVTFDSRQLKLSLFPIGGIADIQEMDARGISQPL